MNAFQPRLAPCPLVWLGAPAAGGLALPDARPTPSQLYAPRGVFLDADRLIVADSGNHRVLIWHRVPDRDGTPADVVLGQPDFRSEGPAAGGPESGMFLPTGVGVVEGRLVVADSWHHRLLIWERVPEQPATPPDRVLGQPDLTTIEPNRGGPVTARGFFWPFGFAWVNGTFWVADTGNRRLLAWHGMPDGDRPADVVLGQPDGASNAENRGGPAGPRSFRWPHALAGDGESLWVADAGNHRVLGWSPAPIEDRDADLVLGQPDFATINELPYAKQGAGRLRFPYALGLGGDWLAVADTANNRVLFWHGPPRAGCGIHADGAIGQPDFEANGENRWQAVDRDTLCWPFGLHWRGARLAVADSGNNRVMIWDSTPLGA